MTWAKLDDRFHENPKILGLDHAAFRLYICGLTYSCAHETEGRLSATVVSALMRQQRIASPASVDLVAAGCWTQSPSEFKIHDFEKYQLPARGELTLHAARKGGLKSVQTRLEKYGSANPRANREVNPGTPVPVPVPVPTMSENKETKETSETKQRSVSPNGSTALVVEVFETWKASTGKTGKTRLDPKRQRIIVRALESYPIEDVLDAVEGWKLIPHNRGENDRHRKFNSLELLLRDAEHIETFRDAKRGQGVATVEDRGSGEPFDERFRERYVLVNGEPRGIGEPE